MRQWAFARISLKLTDEEFARYTPAQIEALTQVWEEERQWDLASATAAALNSNWSHKENLLPFSPKDFLPKTPEDLEQIAKQQAALQRAQQQFLAGSLNAMARSLKKPNGQENRTP